jgi:tetratricopeptide (TPR) repeat protein
MRHAERWVYRYRLSLCGRGQAGEPDDQPAPAAAAEPPPALPATEAVVSLANGRCNLTASAARSGRNLRSMRKQLDEVAGRLGRDAEYLGFWRARLGEAMTGLAADLLRDRGLVSLLVRERARPDPRARLRRIRRLAARFQVRRATIAERRAMSCWMRRPRLDDSAPRRLLEQAVALCPQQASAWLWLFEACFAAGDLAAAARAIRACRRRAPGPRGSIALARARLLEARGRWPAAIALLRRARARWPREVRLRLALASVSAAG